MTLLTYTNKLKIQNTFKIYVICFLTTSGFMYLSGNFYLYKGDYISDNLGVDCDLHRKLLQGKVVSDEIVMKKRPLLNCLDTDDEYLSYVIGRDLLIPPAIRSQKYYLQVEKSLELEAHPQALDVMEMVFQYQLKKGFFVEAGAADCELSETLPLEYKYGWTGVLIEPNPTYFEECKEVGRKAYLMNSCIGTQNTPHFSSFNFYTAGHDTHTNTTAMGGFTNKENKIYNVEIQCYPLESILAALNNPTVNLFVLDIEGFELAVLRAINWDKVNIEVLSVEIEHAGEFMKDSSPQMIDDFMKNKGYKRFRHRKRKHHLTGEDLDALYVRNDIVKQYNVVQF